MRRTYYADQFLEVFEAIDERERKSLIGRGPSRVNRGIVAPNWRVIDAMPMNIGAGEGNRIMAEKYLYPSHLLMLALL